MQTPPCDMIAVLHRLVKEHPMHREIAYFPRDFIYLFQTSMSFPFAFTQFTASKIRYNRRSRVTYAC